MKTTQRLVCALALVVTLFPFSTGGSCLAQNRVRGYGSVQRTIDQIFSEAFPADGPGAAVIATRNGEVVFRGGYGLADMELGVPIEPDMVFPIASITKEFTAALTLQLVEQGAISLADEITKYLPDFPVHGYHPTVGHLLSHTSGVPNFFQKPEFQANIRNDHTLEEVIAYFAGDPFDFPPGEKYGYSNSGYIDRKSVV